MTDHDTPGSGRRFPSRGRHTLITTLVAASLTAGALLNGYGLVRASSPAARVRHHAGKSGGTLTFGLQTAPDSLDPNYAPAAVDYRVMRAIFDSLVYETKNGKFKPWLATSWKITNHGTIYTFNLRKGVKFQDGTPFNAKAVCYNFSRIENPQEGSRYAISLIGPYKSCKTRGNYTAVISLRHAYAPLMSALSGAFLGMVSPKAANKWGFKDFGMHPVGTGPFTFVSYTLNQQIVLKRNPAYHWAYSGAKHNGPAYLSQLIFKIIPDDTSRIDSVTSGQLSAAETVPAQEVGSLKRNRNVQVAEVATPGAPYQLFINEDHAPWNSVKARRALRAAMDIKDVAKSLYFGVQPMAWGPVAPPTYGYSKAVQNSWKYNPALATKLFGQLGWKKASDGFLQKDGKTLTLNYLEGSPNRDKRQDIANFLAQGLQQVGVKVNTQFQTVGPLVNELESGTYDIAGLSLVNGDADVMYQEYYSGFVPNTTHLGFNFAHVRSTKLDSMLIKGQEMPNGAKRKAEYALAQRFVVNNVISIPVYVQTYTVVSSKKVHNLEFDQQAYPVFYDASL